MLPLLEDLAPCPACSQPHPRPLHVVRNLRPIVQVPFIAVVGCLACGLVYSSPRPSAADLKRFYDRDVECGWSKGQNLDDPETRAKLQRSLDAKHVRTRRLLDAAEPWMQLAGRAGGQAFDFGCGAGAFLDILRERGLETTGLEPAGFRAEVALRHRMIDEIPAEPRFDVIVIHHVLEHVVDPAGTLEAFAAAARPEAVLFCSVPDLEGLPRHTDFHYVMNSVHINAFTASSLRHLLRRTGWRTLHAASGGMIPEPTRLMVVASRDDAARQEGPDARAIGAAEDALRQFGRQLGPDGRLRSEPPTKV
jgi:2-polyprenyl-3-methyl-5-hydroxy-6-metoxy-1,4-benzoquinol methylase